MRKSYSLGHVSCVSFFCSKFVYLPCACVCKSYHSTDHVWVPRRHFHIYAHRIFFIVISWRRKTKTHIIIHESIYQSAWQYDFSCKYAVAVEMEIQLAIEKTENNGVATAHWPTPETYPHSNAGNSIISRTWKISPQLEMHSFQSGILWVVRSSFWCWENKQQK